MYLRTTTRRAGDGTVVRYVQLAHNRRVNGVTRAQVLANLGREEHLDREGLRRLMSSITRWLGEDPAAACAAPGVPALDLLRVLDVRPIGAAWLLDGLWKALGVDTALAAGADPRRWTPDAERIAFAGVVARAVAPEAVPALHEWVRRCVHLPGLESLTPGEVPAVSALVAVTDLDLRLGAGGPCAARAAAVAGAAGPPRALEAFRSTDERVRFGDAVLGWLAGVLVRTAEERCGLPWSVVRPDVDRLAAVTVAAPHGTLTTVSEPTDVQRELFAACAVDVPPRVLALSLT